MVRGEPGPVLSRGGPASPVELRREAGRRAGVVGSPVEHSLSPVLHRAAHAALGLEGWSYGRHEVPRGGLAAHVAALGAEWVGLSVTMPGKEEALALAAEASAEAELSGAANTLVRRPDGAAGWYADNTDIYGLATALAEAGADRVRRGTVLGGGATARSALLALRRLGADEVDLLVRDRVRPETRLLLDRLSGQPGAPVVRVRPLADGIPLDRAESDVVVGTLPGGTPAPPCRAAGPERPVVIEVAYAPWPGTLARAVRAATGGSLTVVRGTTMLLHQAVRQVELMTGRTPPVDAMAAALAETLAEGRE